jgi:hypothetical protein
MQGLATATAGSVPPVAGPGEAGGARPGRGDAVMYGDGRRRPCRVDHSAAMRNSTRRLARRPSSVSFEATGSSSP